MKPLKPATNNYRKQNVPLQHHESDARLKLPQIPITRIMIVSLQCSWWCAVRSEPVESRRVPTFVVVDYRTGLWTWIGLAAPVDGNTIWNHYATVSLKPYSDLILNQD
jgi:hypothetical protein